MKNLTYFSLLKYSNIYWVVLCCDVVLLSGEHNTTHRKSLCCFIPILEEDEAFYDMRKKIVRRLPSWQRSGVVSQQRLRLRRFDSLVKRSPKLRSEPVSFLFLVCFSFTTSTSPTAIFNSRTTKILSLLGLRRSKRDTSKYQSLFL